MHRSNALKWKKSVLENYYKNENLHKLNNGLFIINRHELTKDNKPSREENLKKIQLSFKSRRKFQDNFSFLGIDNSIDNNYSINSIHKFNSFYENKLACNSDNFKNKKIKFKTKNIMPSINSQYCVLYTSNPMAQKNPIQFIYSNSHID